MFVTQYYDIWSKNGQTPHAWQELRPLPVNATKRLCVIMNTQNTLPAAATLAGDPSSTESFANGLPLRASMHVSIFRFFTFSMVGMVLAVVGVLYWAKDLVLPTFLHHKELNGIIFGLTVYGIYRVFSNSYSLYETARYVKSIERMEQNPSANEATIATLIAKLAGPGSMLDIQNTELALRRMLKSGFFVITDNDSRLIKSKIGARVRYRYNHIAFFAGILISFGLLGTFVGLIATVASVGEQMGAISKSLSKGEQMNVIDLIAGISKPLSGMGTAFGASLFGLGGSMLLGGLNHVAGHAQDDFMENLSRWLDDRIPSIKGATADKAAEKMGVTSSSITGKTMSLETGTFMVLAEDTHKQLRAIGGFMEELAATLRRQQEGTVALQGMHQQHSQHLQALEKQLGQIPAIGQQLLSALGNWHSTMGQHYQAHNQQLTQLHGNLQALPQTGDKISSELREFRTAFAQQQSQQLTQQVQTGDKLAAQVHQLAQVLQAFGNSANASATLSAQPLNPPVPSKPQSGGMFGMLKK